ncbi:Putative transposase [Planctomycetes bacterium Poly30]|uniref:Transposase n=1 Tax=Saltatorellus ferox TaxID=2528018 RepID=A0A518EMK3_9BACT|nr:Putative transposase [Planctomycetes bacterium Poly30]
MVNADGFSLHAATLIRKGQRAQLEKLCRYVTRAAISLERFEVRPDGMVSWLLRKAWREGTKGFVMKPYQFLARLAAIVAGPNPTQIRHIEPSDETLRFWTRLSTARDSPVENMLCARG